MLEATPKPALTQPHAAARSVRAASVAAIIVTWNRREDVGRVLDRLARQANACQAMHVVVVDNASSDGTGDAIIASHRPDAVLDNASRTALEPSLTATTAGRSGMNTAGFASLTLVRNAHNLGGCGGFNTGLRVVEARLGGPGSAQGPEFVWLLDDDIDLPPDALSQLLRAAATDPGIALVGSRTVDLADRKTTIESTIYFDARQGMMTPEPPPGHPLEAEHQRWASQEPRHRFAGLRDVDVVSACSMLVRWSAIEGVGYWDDRFFIYCDDADWCLRVKRAGGRVVCALDAIVYHTPWTHKLTPIRAYYLHRNLLWMVRKHLTGRSLRRVSLRWCGRLLRQARSAALNRRMTEAVLTLRSLNDAIRGRGGRLDPPSTATDTLAALDEVGALPGEVLVVVQGRRGYLDAERLRASITNALVNEGRSGRLPRWRYLMMEGTPTIEHGGDTPDRGEDRPEIVRWRPTRGSKLMTNMRAFRRRPPDAVLVIDRCCEFPVLFGSTTLHLSADSWERCEVEPGGPLALVRFGTSWCAASVRSLRYSVTVRQDTRADRAPSAATSA
ncbi:MAG: glycosyltransferase family 2 protein [Phycisphaerales bacterium]